MIAAGGIAAVLFLTGCGDSADEAACRDLVENHRERVETADASLDELLGYREAVSLHDRTHHDLQFEHAKAVVERESALLAAEDAGCEVG